MAARQVAGKEIRRRHRADYSFFLMVAVLCLFGLLMILSAGSVQSFKVAGNGYFYFKQQLISLAIGALAFWLTQRIHYTVWKRFAFPLLVVAIAMLLGVFIPGIGFSYGGASRWINLHFTLLQASEVAKFALVIYLATWLSHTGDDIDDLRKGFVPFATIVGIPALLVIAQPDMGTMSILVLIGVAMYYTAGAPLRHLGIAAGGAAAALVALIAVAPYRINRLLTFLDPSKDTLGTGYHVQQALVAIGSGGLFGVGFNNSLQKHFFLPEPMNDSIYAVISEELGFFVSLAVIVMFAVLAVRGLKIARDAPDTYSRLLVVGIITWVTWQALINIAAMLSLVPLTGVPLPFISLGGSSLVVLMAAMGIVFNISKYTQAKGGGDERVGSRRGHRRSRRSTARGVGAA